MTVGVVACGALALHVRAIARRRGLDLDVHAAAAAAAQPARAHRAGGDREARRAARPPRARRRRLRRLRQLRRARRRARGRRASSGSPGDTATTCFGLDEVREALAEEPGTYFLTDFLARTFEHTSGARSASTAIPSCATTTSTTTAAASGSRSGRRPRCARPPSTRPRCSACRSTERRRRRGRARARAGAHLQRGGRHEGAGGRRRHRRGHRRLLGRALPHARRRAQRRRVDQGPIGDTGGSSFHAPGLVLPDATARSSRARSRSGRRELYRELDTPERRTWWEVGSLEVATTPERLAELERRHAYATSWGLASHVITPEEARRGTSRCSTASSLLGALHVPSDGIAKRRQHLPGAAGAAPRRAARVQRPHARDRHRHERRPRARRSRPTRARSRTSTALVCARPLGAGVHARARPAAGRDAADAAPLRLDGAAARAGRRRRRDRAPDPAPPGSRDVLPPARRGLRHRRLRARRRSRSSRTSSSATPTATRSRPGPFSRGALARVARLGAASCCRRSRASASPRRSTATSRSRSTTTRSPAPLDRRRRACGSPTASG